MRRILAIAAVLLVTALAYADEVAAPKKVLAITVDGVINPVSAERIQRAIKHANDGGFEALVIQLDTPGGLMDSMRTIVKDILASDAPVIVYVAPGGARAASAGAFITIAAHVAAMAPGTNIGAAHPVGANGQQMDETMAGKVTNDAVAFIRSIADQRGRNADWAEAAVANSISSTADEALKKKVIDLIAPTLSELLAAIDGRTVNTITGKRTLATKGAEIVFEEHSFRQRVLDIISNPNVAYILMLLGFYGLFFEMTNPGAIFPGVIGGICLILAFYAFQTLPVNYAGVLLVLVGIIMFVLETQIASHGALAIGGIIAMTLGSVMLYDEALGGPFVKLSRSLVAASTLTSAAFFIFAMRMVIKAHRARPSSGVESLAGTEGVATEDIGPSGGQVFIHGEYWNAISDHPITKGQTVVVMEVNGLKLKVRGK